jgi:hypothetical protein
MRPQPDRRVLTLDPSHFTLFHGLEIAAIRYRSRPVAAFVSGRHVNRSCSASSRSSETGSTRLTGGAITASHPRAPLRRRSSRTRALLAPSAVERGFLRRKSGKVLSGLA